MPPSEIHFVSVGNGKLALYHRPRGVDFRTLRELGCTHVVTLMKESEGARSIGKMTENAGLTWVWIPVPNGDYPQGEVHQRLIKPFGDYYLPILNRKPISGYALGLLESLCPRVFGGSIEPQ